VADMADLSSRAMWSRGHWSGWLHCLKSPWKCFFFHFPRNWKNLEKTI